MKVGINMNPNFQFSQSESIMSMQTIPFEDKNYPIRTLTVLVDGEEEDWVIGVKSLLDDMENSLSFSKLIIDETIIFYVDDEDINSPDLAQIVSENIDIDHQFVCYVD